MTDERNQRTPAPQPGQSDQPVHPVPDQPDQAEQSDRSDQSAQSVPIQPVPGRSDHVDRPSAASPSAAAPGPFPTVVDPAGPANMLADRTPAGPAAPPLLRPADDPGAGADPGLSAADIDRGLARLDPLTVRPRTSSRVLCAVFGLLLLAAAAGVWWLGVRTVDGQSYDDMVYTYLPDMLPGWMAPVVGVFAVSLVVEVVAALLAVGALASAVARRRWWLIGQAAAFGLLCLAVSRLKYVLPRPFLVYTESNAVNSAPSGHTILAAAAGMALLLTVPRVGRAIVAVLGAAFAFLVAVSVIDAHWHRTTDVVMALLLTGGLALLALAFTRTSGMDAPGGRASSPAVQIVGTVMVTGGVMASLYAAYLIWQIQPGLELSAEWARSGACASTVALTAGVTLLVFGLVLAMRQITAAPLSRAGLVGAPPAPPHR